MTTPQLENGYTKIANEILEALAKIRISGEARQMLDVIIRKTYGFNKKIEAIPTSKFVELTGLSPMAIYKARKKLLELNLITISQKGESQILNYSFQKSHKDWKPLSKKEALSQKGDGRVTISQKGDTPSPKKETPLSQKGDYILKRNLSKETIKEKKNKQKEIERDFNFFWDKYNYKIDKPTCVEYWTGKKKLKNGKKMSDDMKKECLDNIGKYVANTFKDKYPTRKHPRTYLYNSSWNDEVIEIKDKEPTGTVEERMAEGRRLYGNRNN